MRIGSKTERLRPRLQAVSYTHLETRWARQERIQVSLVKIYHILRITSILFFLEKSFSAYFYENFFIF